MTDATDLWTAVKASYPAPYLLQLTNRGATEQTTINDTVGENAAQGVIDLWPAYVQAEYDATNALHVEAGKQAVIGMLWRRGGSSTEDAKVEWSEIVGPDGVLAMVRKTGARGRQSPATNSGVESIPEDRHGPVLGWSDPNALPNGLLPNTRSARGL